MDYLKVYTRFRKDISALSDAEKGRLFDAMLKYAEDGTAPQLTGSERIMWPVAEQNIDFARKESDKQTENGGKGGRPRKNPETQQNPTKPTETQQNPTKAYNVNNNVNVNDNEKEENDGGGSKTRTRESFPPQDDELEDPQATDVPEWIDMLSMYGIKMATGAWQEMREMQEQGIGGDLICWAIEQAVNAGACNWNYLSRVLNNCLKLGCKTRARAEELAAQRKAELAKPKEAPVKPVYQKPQEPKKVSAQNYEQRQYTDDFMAGFADDALAEARRLHAERARQTA
jgi:hypothetical protein